MSRDSTALTTRTSKAKRGSLRGGLKWLYLRILRLSGWKCEGPFPRPTHQAILIMGPGLEQGRAITSLAEHRMNFTADWIYPQVDGMHSSPLPEQNLLLVDHCSSHLADCLDQAAVRGISIQLIRMVRSERRIQCNTPFKPSKFPERDLAYIHRMFS